MSALARILVDRGHPVSGSDPRRNATVRQLTELGVRIFPEQSAATIQTITESGLQPTVVISSAIPEHNPELMEARAAGLPVWHRSDLLAALIAAQPSIAVAGSHGKTTTSTLITTLLVQAGEDHRRRRHLPCPTATVMPARDGFWWRKPMNPMAHW